MWVCVADLVHGKGIVGSVLTRRYIYRGIAYARTTPRRPFRLSPPTCAFLDACSASHLRLHRRPFRPESLEREFVDEIRRCWIWRFFLSVLAVFSGPLPRPLRRHSPRAAVPEDLLAFGATQMRYDGTQLLVVDLGG